MLSKFDKEVLDSLTMQLLFEDKPHEWGAEGSHIVITDMSITPFVETSFDNVTEATEFLYGKLFDLNR